MEEDIKDEENFKPRKYQEVLTKIATEQNTIIYLPTGTGKTFIAIMVLKQLSTSLNNSYSNNGKLSFILVNSVALVDQHKKYVEDHTIFKVGAYSGEMNLDFWKKEQWEEQFNKHQVIVMTAQILENLLNNCFIDLSRINLLIFDECHRAVDDHAMRLIMKKFQGCLETPRVLGLTATLLNGNCKLNKVMDEVRSLETTFHSKVATVDGLEAVVGYSTNPQEDMKFCVPYQLYSVDQVVIKKLQGVIETLRTVKIIDETNCDASMLANNLKPLESVDILKQLKNLITDLIIHIEMLGTFGGYKACIAHMIQVERVKKHCQDPTVFVVLNFTMTMLGWAKCQFKKTFQDYSDLEKLMRFSSDKVLKLFEILKEFRNKSDEELCCLIFVQRRFTAKIIHHILDTLKNADPHFSYVKSNFVVGQQNNPYNDTRESLYISKKNREVLLSFINKEINILASSSVLEEGIDIPKCTLVIKFDKPEEYRSYIQSKGRARHKKSFYYTIVEAKDAKKFSEKYHNFQMIEDSLNTLLVGKNLEREQPSEREINDLYNEDLFPPYYVNGPNSAQVNMSSAISLLCRYCLSLSSNQWSTSSPEWYVGSNDSSSKVRVVILLPILCPIVEPIEGPFMANKKDAKRAAALAACIKLHKCGELSDELLPHKSTFKEEDVSYMFQHWPKEKEATAGHKKNKRLHNKQVPNCIKGKISPNTNLYLHIIILKPQYQRGEDFNLATVYDFYNSNLCFGLISPKPLPRLCEFPIFDSNGRIDVELQVNAATIRLNEAQIKELREFHYLIFNDLLEILKAYLQFDNDGSTSEMLLVAPVQKDKAAIDTDVLKTYKTLKNKLEPASSERLNLVVTRENYMHKIISPWYRTQPQMYVVTQVCPEKTPLSPFPNEDYRCFTSYYAEKHNLTILNNSQPLLLVKGLSQRLNTLKPRGAESKRRNKARYEEIEEYLVPELVIKQEFPSSLWIQARFLPGILTRLSLLLKAHQLQSTIARDIKVKEVYLRDCPALTVDRHLLNYVPVDSQNINPQIQANILDNTMLALESPGTSLTRQYNKDFTMKMLEVEYAWKNIEEPKDIEREINVTVMDIEYYETFISEKPSQESRTLKNQSPVKSCLPAITFPKEFAEKNLHILEIVFDNQCPNLSTLYQALSTAEANDIVNLERLETLGDSFLKYIASLYIVFKFPTYNEGKATALKGRIVSNKNLYYLGTKINLGGILRNSDLSPENEWTPPCFSIPQFLDTKIANKECSITSLFYCNIDAEEQIAGVSSKKTVDETLKELETIPNDEENSYPSMCNFLHKQYVSDKSVADCVEALLGAHLLSGGISGGIKFVEWVGIIPASEKVATLMDTVNINPVLNPKSTKQNIYFHIPQWREFEDRLGYKFNNHAFLLQALTHSSYSPNRVTQSYERLEFIGDAILDFLITCYIYEHCGILDPGQVTDLRSALVNNNTFASLVVRSGFHKFLLLVNPKLQGFIDKFADYLGTKNYIIDDEVLILLEEDDINLAEYIDVPKVLGDVFEALAGAVFLDSGKNLKTVWKVFYRIMWKELDLFSNNVPKNVIRRLYECHTAYPQFSNAIDANNNKTMVSLTFMCEGRKKCVYGFGTNKTMAKRAAAKIALQSLKV